MTRVLLLSRYGRTGPSSRLRFLDFLDRLRAEGIEVTAAPFFGPSYLEEFYRSGRRPLGPVAAAYAGRIAALLDQSRFDLLWIEKEVFPWIPAWLERRLLRRPYVIDFDDAWFERYRAHPLLRATMPRKLERLVRGARVVIAGNAYLADWARSAGAGRVEIVPTVVRLESFDVDPHRPEDDSRFVIGWAGSPSSAPYLHEIAEPLRALCEDPTVIVRVIGIPDPGLAGVRLEVLPWSEQDEAREIARFDVGIMPLPDTPWTRGKCGFKLIQYMAAGLPVVASPVGANRDIVSAGETGFLATTRDEWVDALSRLRADRALRAAMGRAGRKVVAARYSTDVAVPKLAAILRNAPTVRGRPEPSREPA